MTYGWRPSERCRCGQPWVYYRAQVNQPTVIRCAAGHEPLGSMVRHEIVHAPAGQPLEPLPERTLELCRAILEL